jgi:hypothetical protein
MNTQGTRPHSTPSRSSVLCDQIDLIRTVLSVSNVLPLIHILNCPEVAQLRRLDAAATRPLTPGSNGIWIHPSEYQDHLLAYT